MLDELAEAAHIARRAGATIMSYYGKAQVRTKAAGSPVTEADIAANRQIVQHLRRCFPDDGLLSEESRDSHERLSHERVWIIDPLDGTREFMAGIDEFAVMIGLAVNGSAVLGVVFCPAADLMFTGIIGTGAHLEHAGKRTALLAPPARQSAPRLVGSRSHPDPLLQRIQQQLEITDVRPSGSVGVKCGLIARGECDLYVHPVPYLKEWDTCAPEAVLRAAGGSVSDCDGRALQYNKRDPVQPAGIVATAPGISPHVLPEIQRQWQERQGVPA